MAGVYMWVELCVHISYLTLDYHTKEHLTLIARMATRGVAGQGINYTVTYHPLPPRWSSLCQSLWSECACSRPVGCSLASSLYREERGKWVWHIRSHDFTLHMHVHVLPISPLFENCVLPKRVHSNVCIFQTFAHSRCELTYRRQIVRLHCAKDSEVTPYCALVHATRNVQMEVKLVVRVSTYKYTTGEVGHDITVTCKPNM